MRVLVMSPRVRPELPENVALLHTPALVQPSKR